MRFIKILPLLAIVFIAGGIAVAQDKTLGAIKGKVRVETGTPNGVTVVVRRDEKEVTRSTTDKNGEFLVSRLTPGLYGLTFRKPGLSIGSIEDVEVKAGKTRSPLGAPQTWPQPLRSVVFLSGSVFSADGRSVPNAKVELSRILEDGTTKKIDGRVTTETGSFKFRLAPEPAKYRVSVKPEGADPVTKDVEIDGAAVYRVALNLPRRP